MTFDWTFLRNEVYGIFCGENEKIFFYDLQCFMAICKIRSTNPSGAYQQQWKMAVCRPLKVCKIWCVCAFQNLLNRLQTLCIFIFNIKLRTQTNEYFERALESVLRLNWNTFWRTWGEFSSPQNRGRGIYTLKY